MCEQNGTIDEIFPSFAVDGNRFFCEDMFACFHGFLDHRGTEVLRGRQQNDIDVAFKNFFISVEANEKAVVVDGDTIVPFCLKTVELGGGALLIDVGGDNQLDVWVRRKRVVDRAATATSATNDTEPKGVVFARVNSRGGKGGSRKGRAGRGRGQGPSGRRVREMAGWRRRSGTSGMPRTVAAGPTGSEVRIAS